MNLIEEVPIFKFAVCKEILNKKIFLPTKSEPHATGWDVCAAHKDGKDLVIRPGQYFKIPLGFRVFAPTGWWLQLHPRSSSFTKKQMHNLIGIIDEHYPEELLFAGQYIPDISSMSNDLVIPYGERIGQIVPIKRVNAEMVIISNDEIDALYKQRESFRHGGFGSTSPETKL